VTLPYLISWCCSRLALTVFPQSCCFLPRFLAGDSAASGIALAAPSPYRAREEFNQGAEMASSIGQAVAASRTSVSYRGRALCRRHHAAGMVHGVNVLSPHAHARIRKIEPRKAKAAPGVLLVLTGADGRGRSSRRVYWPP